MAETHALNLNDRLFRPEYEGGNFLQLDSTDVPYSELYHEAGDDLLSRALTRRVSSFFLFPALFCYRHAVEIALKDIVLFWDRIQGRKPRVRKGHKLTTLWPLARPALEHVWPEGDVQELETVGRLLAELEALDPDGWHFRYGIDTAGRNRALPPELEGVDVANLQLTMSKLFALLSGSATVLEEYMGSLAEYAD